MVVGHAYDLPPSETEFHRQEDLMVEFKINHMAFGFAQVLPGEEVIRQLSLKP